MAIMVGTGLGAHGILFKNAEALEILHKADVLVVDKTGTLTVGKPKVVAVTPVPGWTAEEFLQMAASLEKASEHPLADAIVKEAAVRHVSLQPVTVFQARPGQGVEGKVADRDVILGNAAFFDDKRVAYDAERLRLKEMQAQGQTVMLVAVDGWLTGTIAVADPIKATTASAVALLRAPGCAL